VVESTYLEVASSNTWNAWFCVLVVELELVVDELEVDIEVEVAEVVVVGVLEVDIEVEVAEVVVVEGGTLDEPVTMLEDEVAVAGVVVRVSDRLLLVLGVVSMLP
jgi:hypothetical protein